MTNSEQIAPSDVQAIAGRLTSHQRKALCLELVRDGDALKLLWEHQANAATRCALQRKGLWKNRVYSTVFTPLGLAVRDALLNPEQPA